MGEFDRWKQRSKTVRWLFTPDCRSLAETSPDRPYASLETGYRGQNDPPWQKSSYQRDGVRACVSAAGWLATPVVALTAVSRRRPTRTSRRTHRGTVPRRWRVSPCRDRCTQQRGDGLDSKLCLGLVDEVRIVRLGIRHVHLEDDASSALWTVRSKRVGPGFTGVRTRTPGVPGLQRFGRQCLDRRVDHVG